MEKIMHTIRATTPKSTTPTLTDRCNLVFHNLVTAGHSGLGYHDVRGILTDWLHNIEAKTGKKQGKTRSKEVVGNLIVNPTYPVSSIGGRLYHSNMTGNR